MNKFISGMFATAMVFSISAAAAAAPVYESDDSLKNTVKGFDGGAASYQQDLTQIGGQTEVKFDLGDNADYYSVQFAYAEGKNEVSAEYDSGRNVVVLTPSVDAKVEQARSYEIEIAVIERKGKDIISEGYTLHGMVSFDRFQAVESGKRYRSSDGALYDFGKGAENVRISAGEGVDLSIAKSPRGVVNLHMTETGNESIDYMFSAHNLQYRNFVSQPKFTTPVEVTLYADEGTYLYEYADGNLRKAPDAHFTSGVGYTFQTKRLATYIIADNLLSEGVVNENANTVRPSGGTSEDSIGHSGNDIVKDNPTTGTSNATGFIAAVFTLFLAGAGIVNALRRSR